MFFRSTPYPRMTRAKSTRAPRAVVCMGLSAALCLSPPPLRAMCDRTLAGSTQFVVTETVCMSIMPPVRTWEFLSRVQGSKPFTLSPLAEFVLLALTRFCCYSSWNNVRSPRRREITQTTNKLTCLPRIEVGTNCLNGVRRNHWTTETPISYRCKLVSVTDVDDRMFPLFRAAGSENP